MGLSGISASASPFDNVAARTAFSRQAAGARVSGSTAAEPTATGEPTQPAKPKQAGKPELSEEETAAVRKLKARDTQVRAHEAAHLAAAGGLAVSGASFSFQRGPDGVNYAIGGEVSIDVSPGRTPSETISRARTIQGAALAPADPSGQDLAVAAQARQMEMEARAELAREQMEERTAGRSSPTREQLANAYGQSSGRSGRSLSIYA
jgi:hypothetical protein